MLDLQDAVESAFGLNGTGAVLITGIPEFLEVRERALWNMFQLSREPREFLDELIQPATSSLFEVGWHEKKMNSPFDKSSKKFVSFFSRYPNETLVYPADPEFENNNRNIWPSTMPHFRRDLIELKRLLTIAMLGLLKYIDDYLSRLIPSFRPDVHGYWARFNHPDRYSLHSRLIVYAPLGGENQQVQKDWDNWHIDFGLLATATYPLYFSEAGNPVQAGSSCFVFKDRRGKEHEAVFSQDELLVTSSEALFIESAGYIPATPHTVRAPDGMPNNVYRVQSVSFLEPSLDQDIAIPTGETFDEIVGRDPMGHAYRSMDRFGGRCSYKEYVDEVLGFLYR